MTRAQALELLRSHAEERLCVRYRVAPRGQVRFADSLAAKPNLRWPSLAIGLVGMLGCTAPQLGLALTDVDELPVEDWLEPSVVPEVEASEPPVEPCEGSPPGEGGPAESPEFSEVIDVVQPTAATKDDLTVKHYVVIEYEVITTMGVTLPVVSAHERRRERRRLRRVRRRE